MTSAEIDTKKLDEQFGTVLNELYVVYDELVEKERTVSFKARQLADILEQKMIISKQTEWINQICTYICRRVQKDGKDDKLVSLICMALDDKYKNVLERNNLKLLKVSDLPVESYIEFVRIMKAFEKLKSVYPEGVSIPGFQDLAQELYDNKNRFEKLAIQYGIPLPYESRELPGDKKPHIRLKAAEISKQELIRLLQNTAISQWVGHSDDIDNIIESLRDYNYISELVETEEKNVFRTEALRCLLKPLVDRKWQRDWGEWCDILENFYNQGGTYASSKSAVDSTLINQKTGKPIQRKITKEQIDAKHVDYLNDMRFMVTHLRHGAEAAGSTGNPDKIAYFETEDGNKIAEVERYNFTKEQLDSMHIMIIKEMRQLLKETTWVDLLQKRFREKERAYRATRSIELNPVLSEAA